MRLNADIGEGLNTDKHLMPHLDQANIACGGHAGNDSTMRESLRLARYHDVDIGAHPAYPDKENFGRRSPAKTTNVMDCVIRQLVRLAEICHEQGAHIRHIKPHGALYNDLLNDVALAQQTGAGDKVGFHPIFGSAGESADTA